MARETINSMRDAVLSLDNKGKIIMLNPAAERLLDVKAKDTVGSDFAALFVSREELESFNDCILEAIYDPSTPHISEITLSLKDGETRHLVVRTNLLTKDDGQPEGVVVVVADISERVRLLQDRIEQKRIQHQFGQFFIYLLSIFVIGTLVIYLLHTSLKSIDVYGTFFMWVYMVVLLIPSLIAVRIMGIPFSNLGMTLNNWKKSTIEGLVVSVGFVALGFAIVAILRHYSLIPFKPTPFNWLGVLPYYFHCFIQELLGRGVLQSSFERFFEDRRGFKAVLLASIFGGLLHIHFGLLAVAFTFAFSIPVGIFYLRHHNLIGVTIFHGTAGIFAFGSGLL